MSCKDKVAIVTGAAGAGLGRSIALTLAREGAFVVVNYRSSQESADAIVNHINRRGGRAMAVRADIFEAEGCQRLVERTQAEFDQVNICIIGPGGGWHPEPIDQLKPEAAMESIHNETAPILHLMPLVLPGMYARNWGRVIAIATHPTKLSPAYTYNLGKAARVQAMLLAYEQAWSHGVTMNVIAPGPVSGIDSPEAAIEESEGGDRWQARADVSPQDIAEGVVFLCSEAGRFISGCVLPYLFRW